MRKLGPLLIFETIVRGVVDIKCHPIFWPHDPISKHFSIQGYILSSQIPWPSPPMAMTSFLDNPNGKMSLFFIYFIYTRCMTGTMTTPALSFSKKRDLEMRILTVRPASQWSRTCQGRASMATRSSSCSARNTFQRVRSHNFWNQGNKVANKT